MVHRHAGKKSHLNKKKVVSSLNLKKEDVFLDLGCSDGYISVEASKYCRKVFALDYHKESIEKLKKTIKEKKIPNIIPVHADASKKIPVDQKLDIALLSNVIHGFVENNEFDHVIKNLVKIPCKKIYAVEFKKGFFNFGPPDEVKLSSLELETVFKKYGFLPEIKENMGKYHYGIMFSQKNEP
ncbi:methyltransferase domain-containing protein [Candidatus Woesearchaeota archaeon]|nr:methyltransferase domain-containing protein [Candidatus Woesearchaeota archaeon]